MAWRSATWCRARASAIRGSGRRCRPAYRLPPSGPVTRIASPGFAPLRRTAPACGRLAEHGDADHQRAVPGIGVAADQVDAKPLGQLAHARIDPLRQSIGARSRQGDGHDGGTRHARHGRDVGQVHAEGLVADALGAVLVEAEVAAVHQHVGRHQQVGARGRHPGSRSRRRCPVWSTGFDPLAPAADPVDEAEFAGGVGLVHRAHMNAFSMAQARRVT